jgi:acetyl esterase/lipase
LALVLCGAAGGASAKKVPDIPLEKDLVYGTVEGVDLKYDLAKPVEGQGPFPFVLCIHAGGWQLGDKRYWRDEARELAARGYVSATINYRLSPRFKWPAQIEDIRRAIRYFRSRAADLNVAPARFGVVGDDSGGHLALLLGLMGAQEEKDVPVEQSARVQAVTNFFGPTDLRLIRVESTWVQAKVFIAFGRSLDQVVADFVGTGDRSAPAWAEVSPITHVTRDAPPILTIVGTQDPLFSLEQIKGFHEALKQAGAVEELMIVEGAEHDRKSFGDETGALDRMFAFFDKHLKGTRPSNQP